MTSPIVSQLIAKGVIIPDPASVFVDAHINTLLIAPGVVIHPGCRISGTETCLGPGSVIGEEAPVTLTDCQLESNVSLKGGFFSGATFLNGASFGSGAHVRPETLLEEGASCAHTVGLKQTILMPYVTLGSLINFCDCLMAGGTGPKNHSEVGSSYVHFNFTPHQDKATASLIGDVPMGVFLNQPPIFLGGQGGLVGPARIAYGTVVAAGTILRKDVTEANMLVYGQSGSSFRQTPYAAGKFGNLDRIIKNNLHYINNLHALAAWYRDIRPFFLTGTPIRAQCLKSAQGRIQRMIAERIKRLGELVGKVQASASPTPGIVETMVTKWPAWQKSLAAPPPSDPSLRDNFVAMIKPAANQDYVKTIQGLAFEPRSMGEVWLGTLLDGLYRRGPTLLTQEG